ncbi:MAG: GTP pyrophosphokinase family protein [Ruminococcus sp.]|nr:GTP pyrophosphokinase family protein [Ruminococcus sp.]
MNTKMIENISNEDLDTFFDNTRPFFQLMTYYGCALREVETKLQVLNDEFKLNFDRNPIESIKSRIKSVRSIADKLKRKDIHIQGEDIDIVINEIQNNIFDIAGIRVICAFPEDIYKIAEQLISQDDITLIRRKDYIIDPKPNGYRSLHLILEIPVFFSTGKRNMKVEVQLRTIAMDFWASLDHRLKYKKDVKNQEYIAAELKRCADIIFETDYRMQKLRELIDG